jgi:hypothetical protein
MLNMEMLAVIANRDASEDFIHICSSMGLPLTLAALGRGTATREILDMFSLEQSEKAILFSVSTVDRVRKAMKRINSDLFIRTPGAGVLFTIPVSSIGGVNAIKSLAYGAPVERKEYPMPTDQDFELIVVIAAEGTSSLVMDAARNKGGATGGTIVHARGVRSDDAQKFFGIALSEEKEMVFIVCRNWCRNRIMQAIIEGAGQNSAAKSIVFSVPVSSVAGLWNLREEDGGAGGGGAQE